MTRKESLSAFTTKTLLPVTVAAMRNRPYMAVGRRRLVCAADGVSAVNRHKMAYFII